MKALMENKREHTVYPMRRREWKNAEAENRKKNSGAATPNSRFQRIPEVDEI